MARRCRPDLPLELTEEPTAALQGVVDIWVPQPPYFDMAEAARHLAEVLGGEEWRRDEFNRRSAVT